MTNHINLTPFQKAGFFSPRVITNTLFGLALFIVIFFNVFSFFQVSKLVHANEWVIHTYRVIESVDDGFLNLVQIESATRAYMITKNSQNLIDFEGHIQKLYQDFAVAKQLTIDNPGQQAKLKLLEPILQARINLLKKIIADVYKQDKNTQIKLVIQGSELTNKISSLVEEITSSELNLLDQRNISSSSYLNELNHILLLTSILSTFFFVVGIIVLNINLTRQRSFVHEKLRYENLIKSIVEGTNDIMVALDTDFRFMLFNHSFEHEFKSLFGIRPRLGGNIIETLAHIPDEQKKVIDLWRRALNGEEFNLINRFGTGTYQNVYECNFNSIYDETGTLMGASAICRNIQHRIDAEQSLKATNEKLEYAYNELKNHDTEVSLLNEMENALQSCSSIDETMLIISKYCQKLLPFTAGVIYLINPSRNYLEEMIGWNNPNIVEKVFSPRQCWGLRQGKNYLYARNSTSIPCEHMHGQDDDLSYLCVPLLAQNEVIGLMHMVIVDSQHLSEKDVLKLYDDYALLIKNLSVQLALAIANIQLRDTLKNRSIRDPLTGLYNRTYLSEFLGRELQRSQRNHANVAIVMMDIDYFKRLNDHYGHDAGDMVLKELGKLLQEQVRGSDIACRYGGEEFLLIFYDITLEHACERIEKLRLFINEMEVTLSGMLLEKITASFGIALFPDHGITVEALITAADHALFLSKKNGRNQLTVYTKPLSA